MSGTRATKTEAQFAPRTFVLVHGAWHGGWCWRRVADRLIAKGHKVYAQTLSGVGDRKHLLGNKIGLETHIDDVAHLIAWEDLTDIVLVGHSYGGMVISGVAERLPDGVIGSIVFLDAFVPEDGQSLAELIGPLTHNPALKASLEESDGLLLEPIPAAAFKVNEADRALVDAKCTPHPAQTFRDKIAVRGARDRIARKSYIRATVSDSPPFRKVFDSLRSAPDWKLYEVACGHDVMLDAPDRLVEILLEVA